MRTSQLGKGVGRGYEKEVGNEGWRQDGGDKGECGGRKAETRGEEGEEMRKWIQKG